MLIIGVDFLKRTLVIMIENFVYEAISICNVNKRVLKKLIGLLVKKIL
jgi:hypothetical protein